MGPACRPLNSLRIGNRAATRSQLLRGTDGIRPNARTNGRPPFESLALFQNFSWIHDAPRVQGALEYAHDVQFRRTSIPQQLLELVLTDAVLGAEAAAVAVSNVVYAMLNFCRALQKVGSIGVHGLADIEMQVAIANVAEGDNAGSRNLRVNPMVCLCRKCRYCGDRYGHVVLDLSAFDG